MKPESQDMFMLKQMVRDDRYRVDPYMVADAILRRAQMRDETWMGQGDQNECSNPSSTPSSPSTRNPGDPSATDPIRVRPLLGGSC
jgi:hypothetical protein